MESEKRNLLAAIEARKNDKRLYAAGQLTKFMCAADPVGIPRLGEPEDVAALEIYPVQAAELLKKLEDGVQHFVYRE